MKTQALLPAPNSRPTASCTARNELYRGSYPISRLAFSIEQQGECAMWSHVKAASRGLTGFFHSLNGRKLRFGSRPNRAAIRSAYPRSVNAAGETT